MTATYKPVLIAFVAFLVIGVAHLLLLALTRAVTLNPVWGAVIATLPYVAAVCAGLWLGLLAPERTFRQLLVLAAGSALGFGLLNLAHEQFVGPVDFSGAFGHLLVVGMSFPLILVLCLVGGAVGSALRRAMRA